MTTNDIIVFFPKTWKEPRSFKWLHKRFGKFPFIIDCALTMKDKINQGIKYKYAWILMTH